MSTSPDPNQSATSHAPPTTQVQVQQSPSQQTLVLECGICVEQYGEDFNGLPRSLRCGHTYCTKCIGRMMKAKGIECPVCNKLHPLDPPDITQLPPNYAVLDILKSLVERTNPQPVKAPLCEVCSIKPATMVCIDCQPGAQFKFCSQCEKEEHSRPFPPVQRHKRYKIDQVPTPMVIYCTRHHSNQATHFSDKSYEFACEECQQGSDWRTRSANFELIPDAVRRLRDRARTLTWNSKEVIVRLGDAKVRLEKIISDLTPSRAEAKKAIQVKFTEIMDIIQERHQALVNEVEDEYTLRKQNLEKQLSKVLEANRAFVDAYEEINNLNPNNDIEFLIRYRGVASKIETLLRNENKSLLRPVARQDIPVFVPDNIIRQLKTLGAIGGGCAPIDLDCKPNNRSLLQLSWQLPEGYGRLQKFEIEYEHLPDASLAGGKANGIYIQKEPQTCEVSGSVLSTYIDDLCPSYTYKLRLRSLNEAGWGMWSDSIIAQCPDFPVTLLYTKKISRVRIPSNGYYRITAKGAKGVDGEKRSGGRGAIIAGTFFLHAGDVLTILCGGKSTRQKFCSGGGGGTFVAVNEITNENLLIAAGGGGGANGIQFDGCDANKELGGTDGTGPQPGKGGVDGGPGMDAIIPEYGEQGWGYGGAGFAQDSTYASSFLKGGTGGNCGGFGGGGSVGMFGGGGGGGYSGGGGGGGGGGSYVKITAIEKVKEVGWEDDGCVEIAKVAYSYPVDLDRMISDATSGYSTGELGPASAALKPAAFRHNVPSTSAADLSVRPDVMPPESGVVPPNPASNHNSPPSSQQLVVVPQTHPSQPVLVNERVEMILMPEEEAKPPVSFAGNGTGVGVQMHHNPLPPDPTAVSNWLDNQPPLHYVTSTPGVMNPQSQSQGYPPPQPINPVRPNNDPAATGGSTVEPSRGVRELIDYHSQQQHNPTPSYHQAAGFHVSMSEPNMNPPERVQMLPPASIAFQQPLGTNGTDLPYSAGTTDHNPGNQQY